MFFVKCRCLAEDPLSNCSRHPHAHAHTHTQQTGGRVRTIITAMRITVDGRTLGHTAATVEVVSGSQSILLLAVSAEKARIFQVARAATVVSA